MRILSINQSESRKQIQMKTKTQICIQSDKQIKIYLAQGAIEPDVLLDVFNNQY